MFDLLLEEVVFVCNNTTYGSHNPETYSVRIISVYPRCWVPEGYHLFWKR